ncbi:MAG: Sporulation kinase E [Candidatus Dichloromethanomonas elyunquensis]|nr:MAG: Sporulation kinase E [Candidatus Dichloromethanomonas elyunquensis]
MVGYLTDQDHFPREFLGNNLNDVLNRFNELNLMGVMAGGIVHEVRNPLTVVRGRLQLLTCDSELEKYHQELQTLILEIDRAVELLTELLYLSKPTKTKMERQNINEILNQLYPFINAGALVNLQEIVYELEDVPDVMLNQKRFRQVVLNLVNNALQAMEKHKKVIIRTFGKEGKVYFVVQDEGSGIPPEVVKNLGTPFLTTKDSGTGLGLAACYQIIAEHQAGIQVDTSSAGTNFTIIFDEAN